MKEMTELQKQQDAKLNEILTLGWQRYLNAGGDPQRYLSGRHGDDYLTNEERQEALSLARKIAGITVKDAYVYYQGRSWQLPDNSNKQQDKVKS